MFSSIQQALHLNNRLALALNQKMQRMYGGEQQLMYALLYAATSVEHHASICLLIRNRQVGSAFALMRPFVESCYKGLWIKRVATTDDLQRFAKGRDIFPKFAVLCKQLNLAYPKQPSFNEVMSKWGLFCDFTHTGLHQLGGKLKPGRVIGAAYSDLQITYLLELAYMTLLFYSTAVLEFLDQPDDALSILDMHLQLFPNPVQQAKPPS